MTYEVTVVREFVAWHWLTVPDPGPEGEHHAHEFTAEVTLRGPELNEYGYLVDIEDVRAGLDAAVGRYADETMNDLPEFAGLNPSAERLARFLTERFDDATDLDDDVDSRLRLWEDDDAAVTYDP